ncbi:hypothetical protein [Neisseria gonorrhoeae]|uniref:hypothetical protein n=1 Tax=Neisseria gonorrhoeae TaxID=485 RepID=UPI0012F4C358|nr:hypothetical protein [Neisseria gonorrhoeae]
MPSEGSDGIGVGESEALTIHFRLLIRFNRLKKRFSLMLKGGLYRVPGGVSTQYGG